MMITNLYHQKSQVVVSQNPSCGNYFLQSGGKRPGTESNPSVIGSISN